jgi:hypothetical protein
VGGGGSRNGAAGDQTIIIDFLMEKREGGEKWSSASTGPSSEGSEYSVANHHYYQKYELIYQQGCSLAAWHSHLSDTELRLHALIAALAVLPTPRRSRPTLSPTPFGPKQRLRKRCGGLLMTFTNAIDARSRTARSYTARRLPCATTPSTPTPTSSPLASEAAGPTRPALNLLADLFSFLSIHPHLPRNITDNALWRKRCTFLQPVPVPFAEFE